MRAKNGIDDSTSPKRSWGWITRNTKMHKTKKKRQNILKSSNSLIMCSKMKGMTKIDQMANRCLRELKTRI